MQLARDVCVASFAMLCPDGYGYVTGTNGELMEGWLAMLSCMYLTRTSRRRLGPISAL